jgi:hypothetical protein
MPWRVADVMRFYVTTLLAVMVIAIAWWAASGTANVSTQSAWTAVAIGGLIIAGTGNVFWLLAGRTIVAVRRRQLVGFPETTPRAVAPEAVAPPLADTGKLVATKSMTRYHRPDCPLAVGKDARVATLEAHQKKGRRPCGVCNP